MEHSPEVTGYLASLLRDEMVLYAMYCIATGVAVVIGTLIFGRGYKKRIKSMEAKIGDLDVIKAKLAAIESHPIINVSQQVAVHSGSHNEEWRHVMSSTVARIESIPQAEHNRLKKNGKLRDDTVYLIT